MENIIDFNAYVCRQVYGNDGYKIYAMDVDEKLYPNIHKNKYGNVSITGDMPELSQDIRYKIKGIEENGKYGVSYKIVSISADKPIDEEETYNFLKEILTFNQAKELYIHYPNIVEMVIDNPNLKIDLTVLKGIKEKKFKMIKDKIIENFMFVDIINEYCGMLSLNILKKMYEEYKSIETIKKKIKNDPYKTLCRLNKIGFKTADKFLLQMQENGYDFGYDLLTSKQRCLGYIKFLLDENESNGNTYMKLEDLKETVFASVPECSDKFIESLKDEDLALIKETLSVANKKTYETEEYLSNFIKEMLSFKPEPIEINIEKYRKVNGIDLSDDQLSIIKLIQNNKLCILQGFAGTGKSFSTKAVINMLDDIHLSYILMTPTGKSAKVLAENTDRKTSTIHRGLEYKPPTWTYNKDNKLPHDVVIIDEWSMTDIFLAKHLFEAIDRENTRVLLIGDSAQLPSVSCGNVLQDMVSCNKIPTVSLNKVFRYSDGGLMNVATKVRSAEEYLCNINQKITQFGENKDYSFVQTTNENTESNVLSLYKKLLDKYSTDDIMVLTAYRKGRSGTINLNNELQKIANKNYGSVNNYKVGDSTYYVGDIVIQNQNNYQAQIYNCKDFDNTTLVANGETGYINEINSYEDYLVINFDGIDILYQREDMQSVALGYAITIHKSQGASSKIVILSTPSSQQYMLNSNIIYVGITRTKEKCFHIAESDVINRVVHKKENFDRKTLLSYFLANMSVS